MFSVLEDFFFKKRKRFNIERRYEIIKYDINKIVGIGG